MVLKYVVQFPTKAWFISRWCLIVIVGCVPIFHNPNIDIMRSHYISITYPLTTIRSKGLMNGNMEGTQKQGDVPALRAAEDSARAERSKISPGDVANQTWCST
jgi:hypothetical protein